LRSTGWNRWEWLCQNPQDKALMPFDFLISNRLMMKDNHRPCLPKPLDQCAMNPEPKPSMIKPLSDYVKGARQDMIPSVHYRNCSEIRNY
jgi:hypothetical protein